MSPADLLRKKHQTDPEQVIVVEDCRECRVFGSYSGVKLPFNLVNSIAADALSNATHLFAAISTLRES